MNIELKHIYFAYDRDNYILKDLSVEFREGETVAVIGQNGSGKTTLVKQLNGILKPSKGEILFDGESVAGKSVAKLSARVGYVFQNPDDQLFLPTVQKELEFGPLQIGYPESDCVAYARKAASICGMTSYLNMHPLDLGASKKKLCTIAAVLSMQTDVVILDEPTMGQDREGNRKLAEILAYLKAQGKTCIAISHDMKFVAGNFDRVVVLKGGEIWMDGTAAEVFARPDMLEQSYISPPPITRVCQKSHIGDAVFSVEQFSELLKP